MSKAPAAVDWAALQGGALPSAQQASHNLVVSSLVREVHALQLERATAAQTYALDAAQIAALSANLQDALTIQQQLQAKIQMLEYGLKIERKHNAQLMASQRSGPAQTAAAAEAHTSNGLSSANGPASPRRVLTYHTLPSHPAVNQEGEPVDPVMFAAYMAAVEAGAGAESSVSSPRGQHALPQSLPSPKAQRASAASAAGASASAAAAAAGLSNATSALPHTALKQGGDGNVSATSDALSFNYETKSPARTGGGGGAHSTPQPAFKPPSLSAAMFMPPTADEIAAEIALAKSPPGVHHAPFFKAGEEGGKPRANSDSGRSAQPPPPASAGDDRSPSFDRAATVYNYSSGSPQAQPPTELPVPTGDGTSFSYGSPDPAVELSGIQLQVTNGTVPASSAAPAALKTSGHTRGISSSSSAFTALGLGAGGLASPMSSANKQWRPKLQLRSHLDSVRSVAFDRDASSAETWLLSGSEDGTAQIWNLTSALSGSGSARKGAPQPMPVHSYRGHSGQLTSVALHSGLGAFTAGVDGQVLQWALPSKDTDMYASHGTVAAFRQATMQHADAVWAVDLAPAISSSGTNTLLAAVADGSIAVWNTDASGAAKLMRTVRGATGAAPSSVQFMATSGGRLAGVSFVDGSVSVIDVETGDVVSTFKETADDGTPAVKSRATQLVCHPTQDLLVSGHVDHAIRMWDVTSGSRVAVIAAHRGIVSCLALDADGSSLVSGSHDESIRVWSTLDRKIKQVLDTHQTHRLKYDEAIHSVAYHSSLPYLASAGSDGIVKVYV